jgi:cell division protein FtsQ
MNALSSVKTYLPHLLLLTAFVVLFSFGFTRQTTPEEFPELEVNIIDSHENQFVKAEQVKNEIRRGLKAATDTAGNYKLQQLEQHLSSLDFISRAEISRDIKNRIVAEVHQIRPVARLLHPSGRSSYLSAEGELIPLSDDYTSRVLVVTGAGTDSLFSRSYRQSTEGQQLLRLIDHLDDKPFWKSLTAQLNIDEKHELSLYPQVGKQEIQLGSADDFERKLWKLQLFYEKIIPNRGWAAYTKVKLQYNGQIVCE